MINFSGVNMNTWDSLSTYQLNGKTKKLKDVLEVFPKGDPSLQARDSAKVILSISRRGKKTLKRTVAERYCTLYIKNR